MLGRLLGGVATSLLFSVFEAWLIRSHADAKLPKHFLGQSFSSAAYGNSVVAIAAGLMANKAASSTTMEPVSGELVYVGGFLNPVSLKKEWSAHHVNVNVIILIHQNQIQFN